MTDTEPGKMRHLSRSVVQGEAAIELQSHGSCYRRVAHAALSSRTITLPGNSTARSGSARKA